MGKIIDFKSKKKDKPDKETVKLWNFSQNIDELITEQIVDLGVHPEDVAAVLAHRLGTLINATSQKALLKNFCVKTLEKQIDGDESAS